MKNLAVQPARKLEAWVSKNKGMNIAKEWVNCEVTFNGENRKQQLSSLRKKN
jgi:hypothetical protein